MCHVLLWQRFSARCGWSLGSRPEHPAVVPTETLFQCRVQTRSPCRFECRPKNPTGRQRQLYPALLFHYPSSPPPGFDYLKRSVKLEFGSLTDQQPAGRHAIGPWVA